MNSTGRLRISLAIATICAICATFAASTPAQATFPGRNGKIIFASDQDGDYDLYAINPDGSGLVQLTNAPGGDYYPAVSADGRKIVFASDRDGGESELYIMNADGSAQTRLTNGPGNESTSDFSPDGTRIVFTTYRDGVGRLYFMNVDGSNQVPIEAHFEQTSTPSFSPDGTRIAFDSTRDDPGGDIYSMNVDGTGVLRLTSGPQQDVYARFSPDGSKIIWRRDPGGCGADIWRVNADGSNAAQVACGPGHDGEAVYSPDGNFIVTSSTVGSKAELFVMNADGSNATQITEAGSAQYVAWAVAIDPAPPAGTFVVDSTGDERDQLVGDGRCASATGACTLRAAIEEANAFADLNTIHFRLPGTGVATISVARPLPIVDDPLIIDGLTQPGASCASWPPVLRVEIRGDASTIRGPGLEVTASDSTIRGLVVNRHQTHGIMVWGNRNRVECNFFGTDASGRTAAGNGILGVAVNGGQNNLIGGPSLTQRNLISGNHTQIEVGNLPARANVIENNYIGTDVTGSVALRPDDAGGLGLEQPDNVVRNNLISGNQTGLGLHGTTATGNLITGNLIGTDASGTNPIPNRFGIFIRDAANNTIGGVAAGEGNVISGNTRHGIFIDGALTNGNVIIGNEIGTTRGGGVLANGEDGINVFTGFGTVIGGVEPGRGNRIAGNGGIGVSLHPSSSASIRGNVISDNGALGIDLSTMAFFGDGVTANDAQDADDGPNGRQNFPLVSSAQSSSTATTIAGRLDSAPGGSYTLDFYASAACDGSGHGEAGKYLGSTTVTTDAAGSASFNTTVTPAVAVGQFVTATATNAAGETSELGACVAVTAAPVPVSADLTLISSITPNPARVRTPVTVELRVRNNGPVSASNVQLTASAAGRPRLVSQSTSQGSCRFVNGGLTCTLGLLARSTTATVRLVLEWNTPGTYATDAQVRATEPDPVASNNRVSPSIVIRR